MEKKELINIIEENNCDLARIKNVVGLLWDLHVLNIGALKESELREKYMISQTLIETLFELITYKQKESDNNINIIFQKKKEGVANA